MTVGPPSPPTGLGSEPGAQRPTSEWRDQWSRFADDALHLFDEWIAPVSRADFAGCDVLEAGCGGGQHTAILAPLARSVTAVDLNTSDLARERNRMHDNVSFVEADCAVMDLGRDYDVVLAIGMIHHTDDPDRTFDNLYRHLRPGGRMIVWTYSAEGNTLARYLVEPARRLVFAHLPRPVVSALSYAVTACLYLPVHSLYRLEALSWLPYYRYFQNFRRLGFRRNVLNVFDKLNAPQTHFIDQERCRKWMSPERFSADSVSIRRHLDVSWSLSGIRA